MTGDVSLFFYAVKDKTKSGHKGRFVGFIVANNFNDAMMRAKELDYNFLAFGHGIPTEGTKRMGSFKKIMNKNKKKNFGVD